MAGPLKRRGFTLLELLVCLALLSGVLALVLRLGVEATGTLQGAAEDHRFQSQTLFLLQHLEQDLEQAQPEADGRPWLLLGDGAVLRLRAYDADSGRVQAVAYWLDAAGGLHRAPVPFERPGDPAAPALDAPVADYSQGQSAEQTRLAHGLSRVELHPLLSADGGAPEVLLLELEDPSGRHRSALLPVGFRACHRPYPLSPYGPCN